MLQHPVRMPGTDWKEIAVSVEVRKLTMVN